MPLIDQFLKKAVELRASDFHIITGSPPIYRINGELKQLPYQAIGFDLARQVLGEILTDYRRDRFTRFGHVDFSYDVPGVARFRVNVLRSRKGLDAEFRTIPYKVPTLAELGMPPVVERLTKQHQGIVLVTGPTGHGKTTTMAAMVDVVAASRRHHIITIEDPIEYLFESRLAVINQREVGTHTKSFGNALRAALREDPDVIVIGEMRDLESIQLALQAAETGHLVIGTMMTSNAVRTIDRIIDSFPASQQAQVRTSLSDALRGIISQRLIKRADQPGMAAAVEVLLCTIPIASLIREGKVYQIPHIMITGKSQGMVRLDDSLVELVKQRKITTEQAYQYCADAKTLQAALQTSGVRPAAPRQ
jgi:twitching motility protein PilT